ncbi:MAG TPA: site-specific DNA-methyltransferase [Anaerolineales bacterium]|nr:site-specific DNA-methyltransferase [Anaerolineales bacterium]
MPSLNFKGKSIIRTHHLTVPYRQLVPKKKLSLTKTPNLNDNLIIHGDNLEALKALLPSFSGKVKCIYIDPPYNTGNEKWVYNDNVNSPMHQDWLKKTVDREDLTRHDKWLCMMWPRLTLLHELLAEDGVIFISIDDNEVHRLRAVMDEIFGEHNFVTTVIWHKVFAPKNTAQFFSEDHDYIVVYAKSLEIWRPKLLPRTEEMNQRYENPDDDPRDVWSSSDLTARNYYSEGTYEVTSPSGKKFRPTMGTYWRVSPDNFRALDHDKRVWWGPDGDNMPRLKRFLSEVKQGVVPQTLWSYDDVGHTQDAKRELLSILDFETSEDVFVTPKPSHLIKRILQIATDSDSICLDSFAGSGTTAQSVLALNAEDGGNRRFILVEQEYYADSITAERVRRVIKGVPGTKDEALQKGYGGTFSYFTLGPSLNDESVLSGKELPSFSDLARYVFFTTTGEQLDEAQIDEPRYYLGESRHYQVYLLYQPSVDFLKGTPLNTAFAQGWGDQGRKRGWCWPRINIWTTTSCASTGLSSANCRLPFTSSGLSHATQELPTRRPQSLARVFAGAQRRPRQAGASGGAGH